jgi:hypothetical protein
MEIDFEPIDRKMGVVDRWISAFSNYDANGNVEVGEIDTGLLEVVLREFGADFGEKPGITALGYYADRARRPGMNAVWGRSRIDEYNRWADW